MVEEGNDGKREYYWLVRQRQNKTADKETDIWAIEQGNISITPLLANLLDEPSVSFLANLCSELLQELKSAQGRL